MTNQTAERSEAEQMMAANLSASASNQLASDEPQSLCEIGLSESEMWAVVDAHWSHWFATPELDHLLYMNVEDSLQDGLAEKWGVDGPALVEKLKALTIAQRNVVVEEIKRKQAAAE